MVDSVRKISSARALEREAGPKRELPRLGVSFLLYLFPTCTVCYVLKFFLFMGFPIKTVTTCCSIVPISDI